MRFGFAAMGLALIVALPALAQQEPKDEPQRQLGAHVHGQGKLSIATERNSVEMELEAPGNDIVGFEHIARTADQKAAVAKARAVLSKPLALFKLPDAAGCKVTAAKVRLVGGAAHGHAHGTRGQAAKGSAPASHSEFHAEYSLTCTKPELIQAIDFDYFKSFTAAEVLEVRMIGPKGQSKYTVTREKPRLEIRTTS
jgi:hypothetical protein